MLKLPTLTLATFTALIIISPDAVRAAAINNGDFATGDFSGWTTTGQATVQDGQAVLETCYFESLGGGCNEDIRLTNDDGLPIDYEWLHEFLPALPNNLNIKEGSAIKQEIMANAGDTLTFSWNFLTNEEPSVDYNDFAFFTVGNSFEILANTESGNLNSDPLSGFNKSTGYQTRTYTIPTTGPYTLGFGVVDVGPDDLGFYINSALRVDNVQIKSPDAVPEPSTILGTLTAIGFGIKLKRRRANKENKDENCD
ncbi:MAG: PEP-CTERM sorting domain-containing protein [Microcystis panniformis]